MPVIAKEQFDFSTYTRGPLDGLYVPFHYYNEAKAAGFPFPGDRAVMHAMEEVFHFRGLDALIWGQNMGLISPGSVKTIEDSPTWNCSEACEGCDDSIFLLLARKDAAIRRGETWVDEQQATLVHGNFIRDILAQFMRLTNEDQVHAMIIGGTVDNHPHLADINNKWLNLGFNVSDFSDFISYVNEDGSPTELFLKHLAHESGWFKRVAHHVSTDYPRGYGYRESANAVGLFTEFSPLPSKRGRVKEFAQFKGRAREFKSEYGWEGMKLAIRKGVRRVVANMTIFHGNVGYAKQIYDDVASLQEWAKKIESPTEVLFTVSTWQWAPYIRSKDDPKAHQPSTGVLYEDLTVLNDTFEYMHKDTLRRIAQGRQRVSAMSAGYNEAHASRHPLIQSLVIEQRLPYQWPGLSEMLQLTPSADVWLAPMGPGFQNAVEHTTYGGERDREPRSEYNPWFQFHDKSREGLEPDYSNIVTT